VLAIIEMKIVRITYFLSDKIPECFLLFCPMIQ